MCRNDQICAADERGSYQAVRNTNLRFTRRKEHVATVYDATKGDENVE